jgi:hypothetical protein
VAFDAPGQGSLFFVLGDLLLGVRGMKPIFSRFLPLPFLGFVVGVFGAAGVAKPFETGLVSKVLVPRH